MTKEELEVLTVAELILLVEAEKTEQSGREATMLDIKDKINTLQDRYYRLENLSKKHREETALQRDLRKLLFGNN
tara:strand:+ start:2029 stop:2253 length:225 start_codon:yes stop_codon:yes gene_type:complete